MFSAKDFVKWKGRPDLRGQVMGESWQGLLRVETESGDHVEVKPDQVEMLSAAELLAGFKDASSRKVRPSA